MYNDCLELDTQAGLLKVKDNQEHWQTYRKGGVYNGPLPGEFTQPSIQVFPDRSVMLVSEGNVLSAPEIIVVAILADGTALEYIRERKIRFEPGRRRGIVWTCKTLLASEM